MLRLVWGCLSEASCFSRLAVGRWGQKGDGLRADLALARLTAAQHEGFSYCWVSANHRLAMCLFFVGSEMK